MIDLHYWPTPNGKKVTILLEECGLPYRVVPCSIGQGDQFKPEFLAISPNNRMPAIVDHDPQDGGPPIGLFESGAILIYLAEKAGQFYPQDLRRRHEVNQWVIWQMANQGPMCGQAGHLDGIGGDGLGQWAAHRGQDAGDDVGLISREEQRVPHLRRLRLGLHVPFWRDAHASAQRPLQRNVAHSPLASVPPPYRNADLVEEVILGVPGEIHLPAAPLGPSVFGSVILHFEPSLISRRTGVTPNVPRSACPGPSTRTLARPPVAGADGRAGMPGLPSSAGVRRAGAMGREGGTAGGLDLQA